MFPGDASEKPVWEIKRFWDDVQAKARLPGVRVHDLRHMFTSLLVSGGMSLTMIGKWGAAKAPAPAAVTSVPHRSTRP